MLVDIPDYIFADVRNEAQELEHGIVNLAVHIRDYSVHFYRINREKSVVTHRKSEGLPSNSLPVKKLKIVKPKNEQGE